ncbi:MAG: signal peptide peptidase SppA [bacterium]
MDTERVKKGVLYVAVAILTVYLSTILISLIFGLSISGSKGGKIGLIKVEGVIVSSSSFIDQIKRVKDNDSLKALLIRIDSPGGAVTPSQEIYSEIKKFQKETKRKVVVSMANTAASGGYYIACPADRIMANPGTITGSIGVITILPNLKGLFEKVGYEEMVIKSGKYKDIGSSSREMTKEEKEILQNMVDDIHEQFIDAVSESREIEKEKVKEIADGRIFTGRQAREINLIDDLGTLEDAIMLAAELAGIPGKPKVVSLKKERSLFETFKDFLSQTFTATPFNWSPIKLQYILF